MKRLLFLIILSVLVNDLYGPPLATKADDWVDKLYKSMTLDEQIAQLMMIECRPTYGQAHLDMVRSTIDRYKVGGVIFFKGDPLQQVKLTNEFHKRSKVPLMIAIDGEWGLAMRLKNTTSFPYQMGLGGIQDNDLLYKMGKQIGRDCKRMGIHVNFAPVIDINNNPNNPVINYRSFGEDKRNVAAKGWAYSKGMQDEQVMACAKHFPGHGDTDVDSHKDLPVIKHSRKRLDTLEMYPFRQLIDSGVMSVMTAHLYIPAIDKRKNQAISISDKAINGILRKELGFKGLAFTDALNMQGVAKFHEPGELELKALKAGNDILLGPGNIGKAIQLIKAAIANGELTAEYVEHKVKKVLYSKYWVGLNEYQPIKEFGLTQDLNSNYATYLLNELIAAEMCVAKDENELLPIDISSKAKIAVLSIGSKRINDFQRSVKRYHEVENFILPKTFDSRMAVEMRRKMDEFDIVIVSLHGTSKYPSKNYGVSQSAAQLVADLNKKDNCIFVDFGNPYNLKNFQSAKTVVVAFEDKKVYHEKAAQVLFGALKVNAKLSVGVGSSFPLNSGVQIKALPLIQYGDPADVGMRNDVLHKIDLIAKKAVDQHATPGCQVLVARYGKIIYHESFGYHTYSRKNAVKDSDLYDIASLTKIAATTLAIMRLVDEGTISLDDHLSDYLDDLDTTNKKYVTVRQVLTHSAGLKDWIPFYRATTSDPIAYDSIYHKIPDEDFCIKVDDDLYMCKDYQEVIFGKIYTSEMRNHGRYKYSDLGMILMRYLVEEVTNTEFDRYLDSVFYEPMGLHRLSFNPLNKFSKQELVPTEKGSDFRKGLIHGYVHDPAAAMLGGVSGHAGLFSTSADLAAILQMLLNGGYYNGHQFIHPETIKEFTSYQKRGNRRGLGFDKPEPNPNKVNPASDYASARCFGHSGFTGTQMWADPQYGLIYVFLSNRVHPSANNKLLIRNSVRSDIMNVIYESIGNQIVE